jgi:hypothetical protein
MLNAGKPDARTQRLIDPNAVARNVFIGESLDCIYINVNMMGVEFAIDMRRGDST